MKAVDLINFNAFVIFSNIFAHFYLIQAVNRLCVNLLNLMYSRRTIKKEKLDHEDQVRFAVFVALMIPRLCSTLYDRPLLPFISVRPIELGAW